MGKRQDKNLKVFTFRTFYDHFIVKISSGVEELNTLEIGKNSGWSYTFPPAFLQFAYF